MEREKIIYKHTSLEESIKALKPGQDIFVPASELLPRSVRQIAAKVNRENGGGLAWSRGGEGTVIWKKEEEEDEEMAQGR